MYAYYLKRGLRKYLAFLLVSELSDEDKGLTNRVAAVPTSLSGLLAQGFHCPQAPVLVPASAPGSALTSAET